MAVYLIIAVVLAILAVLLFAPAALEFSFVWNENNRQTSMELKYLFIKKKLDKKKPVKKKKEKKKEKKKYKLNDIKQALQLSGTFLGQSKTDLATIFKYAKNRLVVIRLLDIYADFDTENPMNTGILTGGINGGAYTAMSYIDNNMNLKEWNIKITPLFENRDYFDVRIKGIIEIKIAHIIVILLKSVPMLLKLRKLINNKNERK